MEQLLEFAGNHALLVGLFVGLLVLLVGTEVARQLRKYREVTPTQATQLINREDAVVLDVRSANEFQEGHIGGARNIPADALEQHKKQLDKLKDKPVIVCCIAGPRSTKVAGWLTANGFERVYLLSGGIRAWQSENLPLVKRNK
jgi:rhodanese-related sulfurtransferase